MINVEIQVDDEGRFSVGEIPQPRQQPQRAGAQPTTPTRKPYLQPANNVDDALTQAQDILTANPQAEADFKKGYYKERPNPKLSNQRRTPT